MKKLVVGLAVLLVVLVGGYVALVALLNPEAQRKALEQRLEVAFGQPVTVGPLALSVFHGFGVEAKGIQVALDPSFGEGHVITVDRVFADLGFWDYLLHREPVIDKLTFEHPHITLVKREDGVWNFTTLGAPRAGGAPAAAALDGGAAEAPGGARPGILLASACLAFAAPPFGVAGPPAGLAPDVSKVELHGVEIKDCEVSVINRQAEPPTEAVYKNIVLTTQMKPESNGYRLNGTATADSAAAGGEPLAASVPFDALLTPPGASPTWLAQGNIASGRFATRNFALDGVTTNFTLDESQTLHLDPLHVNLYGGTLDGNFDLALTGAGNHFASTGKMENVALDGLLASRPDLASVFKGAATADFAGQGDLGDFNYTLQTLAGEGKLAVDGLQITSINVLAEVAKRGGFNISFDEPGTRIDRVEGNYRIGQGRLTVGNTNLKGINGYADAHADSGWVDLNTPPSLNLTGDVTILPPLFEKAKAASPIADVVLTVVGSQGRVTVPLVVQGPLDHPAVAVRWGAVLRPYIPFGLPIPGLDF